MVTPYVEPLVRSVLDALPSRVAVVDEAGTILVVNEAWRSSASANGLDPESIGEGANYLAMCDSAIGPDAVVAHAAAAGIRDVIAGRREASQFEYSWPAPNEDLAIVFRATPLKLEDRRGAVVIYGPGTAERIAEERLRASARSLALAQATVHLGDWLVRPGMRPFISDQMLRLHYLDPESPDASASPSQAPTIETFLEQIHPDDRDRVLGMRDRWLENPRESATFVYRTNPAVGPVRTLEAQARTVADAAGNALEWHGTVLDVTERERQSAESRRHQRMQSVGRLAGGVAHDFNNILSEIIGFAGFVRDALDHNDARRDDILAVLDAADRAAALTRQLLEFSRQQPSDRRLVDLNQLIDKASPTLRRTIGERITLTVEPAGQAAVVLIDPLQFDQVVLNLVTNARDAMPDGGMLRLSIDVEPTHVCLGVTDTGRGMDDETRQHLFEPFYTSKPMGQNAGLGLATCFGIVEDAGGSIRVESSVGRGSTFLVTLPLAVAMRSDDIERPASATDSTDRAELLLCEDEDGLRRVTVRILEQAGYRVHVARDGHEAIRLIDQFGSRLAAIISDVVMPCCSGDAVAAHAAQRVPTVPVLLTSGYFDETHGLASRSGILRKPVPPAELVRAVKMAIAKTTS